MSRPTGTDAVLHIGEIAERVGLSLRTVRYYEEQGLIKPAGRTEGGFRLYTDEQADRLLLIKQMKPLGFTVQQMRELLQARDRLDHPDIDTRTAAAERIAEFAQDAAAGVVKLQQQLTLAEAFAQQLADATATS